MKKTVLFLCLLSGIFTVHAQTKVLVADSTFQSDGNDYQLSNTNAYYYNSQCLDSATQSTSIDPFGEESTTYQQLYDYYPDSAIYQNISQVFDDNAGMFVNNRRTTYTYTASGSTATSFVENWDGAAWQPFSLSTNTIGAMNELTGSLYQTFDSSSQSYINNTQTLFTYDAGGHITNLETQKWDTTASAWIIQNQFLFVYDASGFHTSDTTKYLDKTSGTLVVQSYYTYYNNSTGLTDSSVEVLPLSNSYQKSYFTYYASGQVQQYTAYEYTDSMLSGGTRITHGYDTTSGVYADTTTIDDLQLPSMDSFTLNSVNINQSLFNADGSPQQYLYIGNIYYTPTPISFSTKTDFTYAPCTSTVLPLTLLNFTGRQQNNNALLQWQTANEVNTSFFTIQRSTDGVHFTTIGNVTASGNNSANKSYAYTDVNISALNVPKLYYRLLITDKDGRITNSKTAELEVSTGKLSVYISPNPVQNVIIIHSPVTMANAVVCITNISGQVIYTSKQNLAAGGLLTIDASRYSKGMYLLTVQSQNKKQVFKIVK